MKLYTNDSIKTAKEFNKKLSKQINKDDDTILTKLSILSMVYSSTLSSADVAELGDILITISQYIADKEREV